MKKITLMTALAASSLVSFNAAAADTVICAAPAAAQAGTAPAAGTAGTTYMIETITPKCSANVYLVGTDGTAGAWYAAGSNSAKGKFSYPASTTSGGVRAGVACAVPGGCTQAEAETQRGVANGYGASGT